MNETPVSLRTARENTIDALCRQFAQDALSMPELERRLAKAREARTREALDALLSDLPASPPAVSRQPGSTARPAPAPSRAPSRERAPAGRGSGDVRTSSSAAFAVMGGTRRAGRWSPPQSMIAVAIMGGVELDFRDAVLTPGGVTDINCFAFWGGVEITVPPDVHVDTHGFALLGGFDQTSELAVEPPPGAPVIRVNGFALMGGVEVRVKERGAGKGGRLERK